MARGRAVENRGHYLGRHGLSTGITFDTLDTGSVEGNSYTVSRGQYILCLDMMVDTEIQRAVYIGSLEGSRYRFSRVQ